MTELVIVIDGSEAEEAARMFDQFDHFLGRELTVAMEGSLAFVQSQVEARTPVNFGTLRASITHEIDTPFPDLTGYVATPKGSEADPYARVIEYGRKPGSKPPPVAAIQLWATRKLQIPEDEIEAVSRFIALAIGHRGFSPEWDVGPTGARMFEEGAAVSEPHIIQLFTNAVKRAVDRFKV